MKGHPTMTATNKGAKARGLLYLAGGRSYAATARELGVGPKAVAAWMKDPAFVAEMEALKARVGARPFDGRALLAAYDAAHGRVVGPPKPPRPRRLPSNPGEEQRRRIGAQYRARGLPEPDWEAL
jgi:hypothetical protein